MAVAESPRPREITTEEVVRWYMHNGMISPFFWAELAWLCLVDQLFQVFEQWGWFEEGAPDRTWRVGGMFV